MVDNRPTKAGGRRYSWHAVVATFVVLAICGFISPHVAAQRPAKERPAGGNQKESLPAKELSPSTGAAESKEKDDKVVAEIENRGRQVIRDKRRPGQPVNRSAASTTSCP
jgi:hypothetical protein